MQNVDSLSKSMMESDAYLDQHLVEGPIIKRQQENVPSENNITLETK